MHVLEELLSCKARKNECPAVTSTVDMGSYKQLYLCGLRAVVLGVVLWQVERTLQRRHRYKMHMEPFIAEIAAKLRGLAAKLRGRIANRTNCENSFSLAQPAGVLLLVTR